MLLLIALANPTLASVKHRFTPAYKVSSAIIMFYFRSHCIDVNPACLNFNSWKHGAA
jgi:hypothetical protein